MHPTHEDRTSGTEGRRADRRLARLRARRLPPPTEQDIEKGKQQWLQGQVQGWGAARAI